MSRDKAAEARVLRQHSDSPDLMDNGCATSLGDLLPHAFAWEASAKGRPFMRAVATQAADEISAVCFLIEQGEMDAASLSRVLSQVGNRLLVAAELDERIAAANREHASHEASESNGVSNGAEAES